jgi:tetratricopeptide (TPR) repeat protein
MPTLSLQKRLQEGRLLWQKGELAQAADIAKTLAEKGHRGLEVYSLLGDCYLGLQQFELALDAYSQALCIEPTHVYLRFLCGEALFHLGRYSEVVALLEGLDPGSDNALRVEHAITLGRSQQFIGLTELAELNLLKAFMANPAHEEAAFNLAAFYEQQGLHRQALQFLEPASKTHSASVRLQYNLGSALSQLGETDRAIAALQTTLRLSPDHAKAHQNLALCHLRSGNLEEGWFHYAWRFNRHAAEGSAAHWQPQTPELPESMTGTEIRVVGEQGIGDELFFMRFLPELGRRGCRVKYQPCNSKLVPLLPQLLAQACFDSVVNATTEVTAEHFQLLVGDLPLALGQATNARYPAPLGLKASPTLVEQWQVRFPILRGSRPCVGLTWRAGSQVLHNPSDPDSRRWLSKATPLEPLVDVLAALDINVVILQRSPESEELQWVQERIGFERCLDASSFDQDLIELLALLDCLDRLVGVSNTNTHLFAGLGKTGDVLVPLPCEFRWQEQATESPWFPGFNVFRQSSDANWQSALSMLKAYLTQRYPCR